METLKLHRANFVDGGRYPTNSTDFHGFVARVSGTGYTRIGQCHWSSLATYRVARRFQVARPFLRSAYAHSARLTCVSTKGLRDTQALLKGGGHRSRSAAQRKGQLTEQRALFCDMIFSG